MQIQHNGVTAFGHRLQNVIGHQAVGIVIHRSGRHGLGRDGRDNFGPGFTAQFDIGGQGHIGGLIGPDHILSKTGAPFLEPGPGCRHGRKGVGFMFHHGHDDAHDGASCKYPNQFRNIVQKKTPGTLAGRFLTFNVLFYSRLPNKCKSMMNRLMKSRYSFRAPIIAFLPMTTWPSDTRYISLIFCVS